jgi:hypothetical protein
MLAVWATLVARIEGIWAERINLVDMLSAMPASRIIGAVIISLVAALLLDAISPRTDSAMVSEVKDWLEAGSGAALTGMDTAVGLGRCFGRTPTTIYLATSSRHGRSTSRSGRMGHTIFSLGCLAPGTATTHWRIPTTSLVLATATSMGLDTAMAAPIGPDTGGRQQSAMCRRRATLPECADNNKQKT